MSTWREHVRPDTLSHWDRLAAAARTATPLDGLPDDLNTQDVLETVLLVAEAKGLLRLTRHAGSADVQIPPRGRPAANAIMALSTGSVQAWGAAVRAVDGIEADPDPAATFRALDAQGPQPESGPQPLMGPQLAAQVAERVLAAEAGVRRREYERSVFAPNGEPTGFAWIPVGTLPPSGFNPQNLGEWATPTGKKGFYVPMRALPDLLMALGIRAGAFLIAETPDAQERTGIVMAAPGHEGEFERLNDLRLGRSVPAADLLSLLERWTQPQETVLQ